MEPCGYCGGSGQIYGRTHDNEGRQVHESPPLITCEYCGGSGEVEDGSKLLPATPPPKKEREGAGLPPWA